jgi:hypothetical protein
MADYVGRKRQVIAAAVTDHVDYCIEKGGFVEVQFEMNKSDFSVGGSTAC